MAVATISTIESTAPTSWKWTFANVHSMHLGLGLGQAVENLSGCFLYRVGQGAGNNHGVNPGIMTVGMVVMHRHVEFERGQMTPLGAACGEGIGVGRKRQLGKFGLQVLQRYSQVEQRRHGHVAGNSGVAIEVEDFHVAPY